MFSTCDSASDTFDQCTKTTVVSTWDGSNGNGGATVVVGAGVGAGVVRSLSVHVPSIKNRANQNT